MKDGMAEDNGDESELLVLRLVPFPDISGAKVVVDVGGVVELIASWDEEADADASILIPPTLLSFVETSLTLTVLNSSRRVTSMTEIASVRTVVLLSVVSSTPPSFRGEEEAAAAAMVTWLVLLPKKWRDPHGNYMLAIFGHMLL